MQNRFSDEDRRVARMLSIGNNSILDKTQDASDRALLCAVAVEALIARLRDSRALSEEQMRLLQTVPTGYRRRARAEGSRTDAQLTEAEQAISEANEDPGELARTGLACVQRLQDPPKAS